jgi:hypothetical protein
MTSPSSDDRWAEIEKAVEIAQNSPRFVVTPEYPCLLELREEIKQLDAALTAIEEMVSELSEADRARFLQLTRLANATANQLPNRTQFFADLAPSDARISAPMP